MSNVVKWPFHKWHRCNDHECFVCSGGLSACVRCGGGEGSLPTDCPGERMSYETERAVCADSVDYVRGLGWIGYAKTGRFTCQ